MYECIFDSPLSYHRLHPCFSLFFIYVRLSYRNVFKKIPNKCALVYECCEILNS